jgi:transcriptional regulator with XRE-family HTH domain
MGCRMDLQVISRDGEPEYAVLPWAQYQALLRAAGLSAAPAAADSAQSPEIANEAQVELPALDQLGPLRVAKGLELAQLARTVGISPSYLEMIERGERVPDAAILRSLAWELGIMGWRGEQ